MICGLRCRVMTVLLPCCKVLMLPGCMSSLPVSSKSCTVHSAVKLGRVMVVEVVKGLGEMPMLVAAFVEGMPVTQLSLMHITFTLSM